jgi:hypothetical protein
MDKHKGFAVPKRVPTNIMIARKLFRKPWNLFPWKIPKRDSKIAKDRSNVLVLPLCVYGLSL